MKYLGTQMKEILALSSLDALIKPKFLQDTRVLQALDEVFEQTEYENFNGFLNSEFAKENFRAMKDSALDLVSTYDPFSRARKDINFCNSLQTNEDGTTAYAISSLSDSLFIVVQTPDSETIITSGLKKNDGVAICKSEKISENVITRETTDFYISRNGNIKMAYDKDDLPLESLELYKN